NDSKWYDFCDELGLYVLDEANLETESNYGTLPRQHRWEKSFYDRCIRMVKRDKNHPSIIGWSTGNECGHGPNHLRAIEDIRQYDPSRFIHQEGETRSLWRHGGLAHTLENSAYKYNDITNSMYVGVQELIGWSKRGTDRRPFIMSEFAHAAGNSCGGLKEYYEAFNQYDGLQGGFVWDWVDQAMLAKDAADNEYWSYSGDFGEPKGQQGSRNSMNGVVSPDRTPYSSAYEFKKLAQPVSVTAIDLKTGRLEIFNKQYFTDMAWLKATWQVLHEGKEVAQGKLPKLNIQPREKQQIKLSLPKIQAGENHLTIRFQPTTDTAWCSKEHLVAFDQFALSSPVEPVDAKTGKVGVDAENGEIKSVAGKTELRFNDEKSALVSMVVNGKETLLAGPALNLWRAPVYNDRGRVRNWRRSGYREPKLQSASTRQINQNGKPTVVIEKSYKGLKEPITHTQSYEIVSEKMIDVTHTITIPEGLPSPPRVGIMFTMPKEYDTVRWFGLGPIETYPDKKSHGIVGIYNGSVSDQLMRYVKPQENGNKTETRWFQIESEDTVVTFQRLGKTFDFSVHHATPHEMENARHLNDISGKDKTVICMDSIMSGVGVTFRGIHKQYIIKPGTYTLRYRMIPESRK
ncbi:MAG: glycoside hydrolase family 2 TIM barrel-domain containing protein, partial [Planctomycetota bacterium]